MYSSFNRKRKIFYECSSSDSESTGDEPTFYKSIGQLKVTKVNPTETRVVNKEKKQRRMETSDKKEVTNEEVISKLKDEPTTFVASTTSSIWIDSEEEKSQCPPPIEINTKVKVADDMPPLSPNPYGPYLHPTAFKPLELKDIFSLCNMSPVKTETREEPITPINAKVLLKTEIKEEPIVPIRVESFVDLTDIIEREEDRGLFQRQENEDVHDDESFGKDFDPVMGEFSSEDDPIDEKPFVTPKRADDNDSKDDRIEGDECDKKVAVKKVVGPNNIIDLVSDDDDESQQSRSDHVHGKDVVSDDESPEIKKDSGDCQQFELFGDYPGFESVPAGEESDEDDDSTKEIPQEPKQVSVDTNVLPMENIDVPLLEEHAEDKKSKKKMDPDRWKTTMKKLIDELLSLPLSPFIEKKDRIYIAFPNDFRQSEKATVIVERLIYWTTSGDSNYIYSGPHELNADFVDTYRVYRMYKVFLHIYFADKPFEILINDPVAIPDAIRTTENGKDVFFLRYAIGHNVLTLNDCSVRQDTHYVIGEELGYVLMRRLGTDMDKVWENFQGKKTKECILAKPIMEFFPPKTTWEDKFLIDKNRDAKRLTTIHCQSALLFQMACLLYRLGRRIDLGHVLLSRERIFALGIPKIPKKGSKRDEENLFLCADNISKFEFFQLNRKGGDALDLLDEGMELLFDDVCEKKNKEMVKFFADCGYRIHTFRIRYEQIAQMNLGFDFDVQAYQEKISMTEKDPQIESVKLSEIIDKLDKKGGQVDSEIKSMLNIIDDEDERALLEYCEDSDDDNDNRRLFCDDDEIDEEEKEAMKLLDENDRKLLQIDSDDEDEAPLLPDGEYTNKDLQRDLRFVYSNIKRLEKLLKSVTEQKQMINQSNLAPEDKKEKLKLLEKEDEELRFALNVERTKYGLAMEIHTGVFPKDITAFYHKDKDEGVRNK